MTSNTLNAVPSVSQAAYRMPTSIRKDRPLTNEELQRMVES